MLRTLGAFLLGALLIGYGATAIPNANFATGSLVKHCYERVFNVDASTDGGFFPRMNSGSTAVYNDSGAIDNPLYFHTPADITDFNVHVESGTETSDCDVNLRDQDNTIIIDHNVGSGNTALDEAGETATACEFGCDETFSPYSIPQGGDVEIFIQDIGATSCRSINAWISYEVCWTE